MRRLVRGCTTESHPLYGTFMAQLSGCIFEWDEQDVDLLMSAKRSELIAAGVTNPTETAVRKAISRKELARHCRRRTRGTQETVHQLETMLLSFSSATDTLGVPLFKPEMADIWAEQKCHVSCLQDGMRLMVLLV